VFGSHWQENAKKILCELEVGKYNPYSPYSLNRTGHNGGLFVVSEAWRNKRC
jgi:hypothetical protein